MDGLLQTFYWRDRAGHEIDVLVERDGRLLLLECKAGATTAADWFSPIGVLAFVYGCSQSARIGSANKPAPKGRVCSPS
ncbi:MAG: DUF4143 domain-containing protein [Terriglobia bacterium]